MKRPLVWMAAALVLGEWMAQYGRIICTVFFSMGIILAAAGQIVYWRDIRICKNMHVMEVFRSRMLLCLPFVFLFGVWSVDLAETPAEFVSELEAQGAADAGQNGMDAVLIGRIEQEEPDGSALRLYVRVISVNGVRQSRGKVLIKTEDMPLEAGGSLRYPIGSVIRANGWLYPFPEARNPGQFDTRNYYAGKNIQAGMHADMIQVDNKGHQWLSNRMFLIRLYLAGVLERVCEGTDAGFFQAVVLGMSRQVDAEQKGLFQAAGIAHLLSVSGLHISCLAMAVYRFCRKKSGSFWAGLCGGSLFLICYGHMIGGSASALRAMIMFGIQMLAACCGRKYDLLSAAAFAAIGILLEYPLQIYQSGFWMTFLAVIGIGTVYPVLSVFIGAKGVGKSVIFSLSIQIATLPVVLYSSYCYPLYGIAVNLVVIPLAGYLLFSGVAAALAGCLSIGIGIFCAGTGHMILQIYTMLCQWMQQLPFARAVTGQPALWQCLLYYGLLLLFLGLLQSFTREEQEEAEPIAVRERRMKKLEQGVRFVGTVAVFLGLYALLGSYPDGSLHVNMLDVGQGECIHIGMPDGKNVVIDGGSTDVEDAGQYRIVPYLLSEGVRKIDLLVLTHPDSDHTNGIREIIEDGRIPIGMVGLSAMEDNADWQEILLLAEESETAVHWITAGEQLKIGEVSFSCLHPYAGHTAADVNGNSIVLRLDYKNSSILFTGDLPTAEEDFLQELEPVDVLKAAHHGSKYANSEALLNACQPKTAIISCGAGNRYGHPHEEVLHRLEAIGCRYYTTADGGALLLATDGNAWRIGQYNCGKEYYADFKPGH